MKQCSPPPQLLPPPSPAAIRSRFERTYSRACVLDVVPPPIFVSLTDVVVLVTGVAVPLGDSRASVIVGVVEISGHKFGGAAAFVTVGNVVHAA
ncbi:Hypothetical predicted protein [Octopus vulgaris]|uniref:Uncharacterized protein n=1 Tax=Octopus vulgaris TaxID=6645 RepID=A0AA36ATK9_OCTVU|nr:Hypothetical predicted protein [Octopus vulgaris]